MNIFITSDTFFGRELSAINGGFQSSEEMEDEIIDKWNEKIKPNDIVYHLGNFSWDPISGESAMAHLHGKIHFIGGSYDKHMSDLSLIKLGRHVLLSPIVEFPKLNLVLSHWPLSNWANKEGGAIHVYGGDKIETIENRFCSNISNWNFTPIDYEFLKELTNTK